VGLFVARFITACVGVAGMWREGEILKRERRKRDLGAKALV